MLLPTVFKTKDLTLIHYKQRTDLGTLEVLSMSFPLHLLFYLATQGWQSRYIWHSFNRSQTFLVFSFSLSFFFLSFHFLSFFFLCVLHAVHALKCVSKKMSNSSFDILNRKFLSKSQVSAIYIFEFPENFKF